MLFVSFSETIVTDIEIVNRARFKVNLSRLPRYLILIRWGAFRVDLVGRNQVIAALTLVAAIVGLKILVF